MTRTGIGPLARAAAVLALLGSSALALAQTQQVYRYVDKDGHVVYSDKPPPADAREAQAKRIGRNTIETSTLSYASVLAQERFPVTLYTFGCGLVCDSAQALLNRRGVPHYNENRWQNMLSDAGYPQTPPPRTAPIGRAPTTAAAASNANAPNAAAPSDAPTAAPAKTGDYPK